MLIEEHVKVVGFSNTQIYLISLIIKISTSFKKVHVGKNKSRIFASFYFREFNPIRENSENKNLAKKRESTVFCLA